MAEVPILRFYKHSNKKDGIGWKTSNDIGVVGPNLQESFDVLETEGLQERAHLYGREGGWSGDLYVIHKRLFRFQNEKSRFMGDSGTGGSKIANVYEVVMNSSAGWSQYLSLLLKGEYNDEIAKRLSDLDFAPRHSYLATDDRVAGTSSKDGLWLNNVVEFGLSLPG